MYITENDHILFLHRHSHKGKTQIVRCALSILRPEHAWHSIELHDRVASRLNHELFIPSDEEEIRRCLSDDGFTIGVWHEDKLVAARTVKTGGEWVNEGLRVMTEPEDPSFSTALTDYMVVDREFRGNNIQFLTYFFSEMQILAMNKKRIVSTVAPMNVFSVENILRCGFHITGLKPLYGGFLRYVTEKRLCETLPIWTNWHRAISIRNIDEQISAITSGCVGYKFIRRKVGGFAMLYAPASLEHPADTRMRRHKQITGADRTTG